MKKQITVVHLRVDYEMLVQSRTRRDEVWQDISPMYCLLEETGVNKLTIHGYVDKEVLAALGLSAEGVDRFVEMKRA